MNKSETHFCGCEICSTYIHDLSGKYSELEVILREAREALNALGIESWVGVQIEVRQNEDYWLIPWRQIQSCKKALDSISKALEGKG